MAEEGAPAGKNPLLTILVLVNTIAVVAVGILQFQAHQREMAKPKIEDIIAAQMKEGEISSEQGPSATGEAVEKEGTLLPLEPFTVNLAQGDGPRRYLRLTAFLKFSLEAKEEEYKSRIPQIRDAIINIINTKRPEDLLKINGKNYLKEEIKASINTFLVNGSVIDVFYVGFQIN